VTAGGNGVVFLEEEHAPMEIIEMKTSAKKQQQKVMMARRGRGAENGIGEGQRAGL